MAPSLGTMTESREERIEKLHKFLDTYSSTTLLVTVSDPFKSRRFLRTKRMFHVTTMDPTGDPGEDQWSVERSFDDFVLLRRTLQNRFPGILISELPEDETHDMFKSTESKLNKQSETLTHWVMHVSRHPFASIDAVFLIFLSGASKFSDAILSLVDRNDMSELAPAYKSTMLTKITAGRARRFFMNTFQRSPTTTLEKLAHEETSHHGRYLHDNEAFTTSAQWWWHEALEVAEEPADAGTLTQGVVYEIARIKTSMKECKAVLLGLAASHKTTAGAYDVLAKTVGSWLGAEYAKDLLGTTDPTQNQVLQEEANQDVVPEDDESGEISNSSQPYRGGLARPSTLPIILAATKGDESDFISMPSALTRAVRRMKRQARTENQLSENALITLIAAIRFEMLYLDTLREAVIDAETRLDDESSLAKMLRSRERTVQTLESQHRSHEMIRTNFPDSERESSADAAEKGYMKAKSARDEFAAKAEPAYHVSSLAKRATLSVELNYFRTERVLRIATFLQEFSDVHAQFGETTSALWGGIGTVGAFPMSSMERMQILQQQPLSKKSRSLYAVLPPKPPISMSARQQQQQQRESQVVVDTQPRAKIQAVREEQATTVQSEGRMTTTQQLQPQQQLQQQPQQQQQLLAGAPTTTSSDGITQESETAVNEMTLAEARAIIAKYKYGGAPVTKLEGDELPSSKSKSPTISRPVVIPSKYAGMYKKRVTPGKRVNRDVQMDHDFEAENPDELTVRRGEILKGLRFADEDTAQWLVVENSQGRRGVVPVGLLSVFSSSDEDEGEEEQKSSRSRARRVSTQSTALAAGAGAGSLNEPSGWQWQQQQPQQQQQQQGGDFEWRRENEELRKQLEQMRMEMQSLKTTTRPQGQQQQQQLMTQEEQPAKQLPPLQVPPQKAFWVKSGMPQGDRGVYTDDNATAMREAFQKHETGVSPKLQPQQQQLLQQQQRPNVAVIPIQQPQQREQEFQQPQQQQQQQPSIRRERVQGEEDSWAHQQQQQQQPQQQQQELQQQQQQPFMSPSSDTTAQQQEQEEAQGKSEKKRTGVLRWILGDGGKDKGQQQHAPPTEAPYEAEDEEGKREESTSGESGRTAALFVNKGPLEGGGKADYAPTSAASSEIPRAEQQQQQPQQQVEQQEQASSSSNSSSSAADEAANWVQGFDPKYQRNFYFNTRTKESTWNKPASWRAGGGKTSATTQAATQEQQPMTA